MNQLQSLLHDSLIATGHVQQCAIIRRKDTSLRASTVGFSVSLNEQLTEEILKVERGNFPAVFSSCKQGNWRA